MSARFTVLGSGSGGNASLLESQGFGLLIDFGFNAKQLTLRMSQCGFEWDAVHAAILTHTHSDHWRETALAKLAKHGIPVYCQAEHEQYLLASSAAFGEMADLGLVKRFAVGEWLKFGPGLKARAFAVPHDSPSTVGFRFEGGAGKSTSNWALGYAADLGTWDDRIVEQLRNVNLLALEFNHDEHMQRTSDRPWMLIDRVLGDGGHLSNSQAALLLRQVLRTSAADGLHTVIALHQSRQCNRAALALSAARAECGKHIHVEVADQFAPSPVFQLVPSIVGTRKSPRSSTRKPAVGASTPHLQR